MITLCLDKYIQLFNIFDIVHKLLITMKRFIYLIYLFCVVAIAQPTSDGMYFDGVDDIFIVPNTSNINSTTTNNRTYETYFKITSTTSRQVIMKEGGGTRAVMIYVENGYLVLGAYNRTDYSPNWQGTFYRKAISANTWYHLALLFDNALPGNATTNPMNATANTALKFYLDGVLEADNSGYQLGAHNSIRLGYKNETLRFPNCGTWTATSGTAEYCFGTTSGDNGGNEYYFQGNLWGFRVWNDVRTITEINENMDTIITTVGTDDLVAALDGDTFTYLNSSDVPVDVSNSNPAASITWKANASTSDWNTGTNWVGNVVPDALKFEPAIIQVSTNYPIITNHVIAGDLEVQSGAEITINDGGTLDVSYDLLNDGTITVNNNGSLINREGKPVGGSGSFVIERDSPNYALTNMFSVWSTPVAETDSEIGGIFTDTVITYEFDASQNPGVYVQVPRTDYMEVGKGYFIRPTTQNGIQTRIFNGTVNNGSIDETIYHNSATDNFNLIGNPYPSALDWVKLYDDNSDILTGTMYYWSQSVVGINNNAGDYISYTSGSGSAEPGITGDIATGLGVFVKSSQAGTITYKNSQRVVGSNDQFLRSATNDDDGKSWFRLTGASGYSPILIGFLPGATDGYEDTFDATFVNEGASVEFYTFIESSKYETQGRSELQANQFVQVPMGFQVTTGGDYTISKVLDYIDSNFEIFLEDALLNTMTDLRMADYTFNVSGPTEDDSRFVMHYNYNASLSSDEFIDESNTVNSFFLNNELVTKINSVESPSTIQLFDMKGEELLNTNYNERIATSNLSTGIYIAKYLFKDSQFITKKVIKK